MELDGIRADKSRFLGVKFKIFLIKPKSGKIENLGFLGF